MADSRGLARRRADALALAVLLLAVALRLEPNFRWPIWGSDTGEYVYLTERLLATGRISFAYDGWGIAYPFFPATYVVAGAVSAVTGLDALAALRWVVPALGGLVGLGVLLVAHRATGSATAAVVAGAVAAVTAPNVLVTSHAMPGTLGHVLLLGGLVVVAASRADRRAAWLLVPLVPALLLAHHLSLYFLVGIVAGAAFLREIGSARSDRRALAVEVPLVVASVALAAWWWLGVSDVMRENIVGDAFDASPVLTAAVFLAALAALPVAVLARRRFLPRLAWRPRAPGARASVRRALVVLAVLYGAVGVVTVTGIPGTSITATPATYVWLTPVALWLALVGVGAAATKATRDGHLLWGWSAAILVSLAFSMITGNRVLFPYRHLDYLVEALAAVAGVGAAVVVGLAAARGPRARAGAVAALVLVVAAGAAGAYPPREAIGGFEEAVSEGEWAGVLWARDHLPEDATIAADHRVSSLLFGVAHLRPSWDATPRTYHGESWADVAAELALIDLPGHPRVRVDHVFLSPEIRRGVTLVQWEPSSPMSDAAWDKFFRDPRFETLYAVDDVHVLRIRWEAA